jgi:antitoxin component YwqK of YwqJK toxin-antitoxin module
MNQISRPCQIQLNSFPLSGKLITLENGVKRQITYLKGLELVKVLAKLPDGNMMKYFIIDGNNFEGPAKIFYKNGDILDFHYVKNQRMGHAIVKKINGEVFENTAIENPSSEWKRV